MRAVVTTVLEVAGLICLSVGAALILPAAGLLVLGVGLIAAGGLNG